MSNITARVKIRGTRTLLWNHFTEEALSAERKERTGIAGNDPEEWKRKVLADEAGRLYVMGNYAFGCIRDGAKYVKKGRGSIQPLVAGTLNIVDKKIYIQDRLLPPEPLPRDPELPVYLDVRYAVNPTTKKGNLRYRVACSPGWEAEFTIEFDPTIVARNLMEQACRDAGAFCGIGDARAIGCGRFEVVEFAVE